MAMIKLVKILNRLKRRSRVSTIKHIFFLFIFSSIGLIHAETIRIMPLGDSITYDWTFSDMENPRPSGYRYAYRYYLWHQLQAAQYDVDFVGSRIAGEWIQPTFDTDNEGYPGWESIEIANIIYAKLVAHPADIILLHIGTNDWSASTYGINRILDEIDRYEETYDHKITVILARILNSPLDYAHLTNLNLNIQTLADTRISNGDDIVVVDMENGAGINYATDFQDSFHPNDMGYNKMATMWFNAIEEILNRNNDNYAWLVPIYGLIL